MADRRRHFALGGFALSVLLLLSAWSAQAATLFVTNIHDTGAGSLRSEILAASSGDVINFNVSGTIMLGSSLPTIGKNLTIDGSGQSITVDGANSFEIFSVNSVGTLNLKFLTLAHGSATNTTPGGTGEGGAIFNFGTLNVTNCTFLDNNAIGGFGTEIGGGGVGGAIANLGGTLTVSNSTFSGNQATGGASAGKGGNGQGGAIFTDSADAMSITNSTFSGNQAVGAAGDGQGAGGAIFNAGTLSMLTVTNSTFSGNEATGGVPIAGAIANTFGTVSLKSTILADGSPHNCGGGSITDAGYNISDDNSCGFTMAPGGTSVNNSMTLHLDPLGLQNNGGPTNTIALELDSEAVDFIPVANCTDQSAVPLTTDQRGFPRPDFGNPRFCDAGAFELQTTPIVIEASGERVQIVHASNPGGNQLNTAFTFIENGSPTCDAADDAFNGFTVTLSSGTCADLGNNALSLGLDAFAVHTVNKESYGTFYFADAPFTVSARMVELPPPVSPACGEFTVNLEVTGFDLTFLGNGPFALIVSNSDGDQGCLDITNAIVGNQIVTPGHGVRRVRRR